MADQDPTQTQEPQDDPTQTAEVQDFAPGEFTRALFGGDEEVEGGLDALDAPTDGEPEGVEPPDGAGDDNPDDTAEVKFGQETFKISKRDEAAYKAMEKAFRKKQSEADRATEDSKRLKTHLDTLTAQVALLTAGNGRASTGSGNGATGALSPAGGRQPDLVDEVFTEATKLDEELGAGGKLKAFTEKLLRFTAEVGTSVKRKVDEQYGQTAEMVAMREEMPVRVAQQLEMDAEDEELADIVAQVDADEMSNYLINAAVSAKRAGKSFNLKEAYHKRLLAIAKQVSTVGDSIGDGDAGGGEARNGHSSATSRSGGNASSSPRKPNTSSRIPQALKPSRPRAWSQQAYDTEMRKTFA